MAFAPPPNLQRGAFLCGLSYGSAALMPIYGLAFVAGAWTGGPRPDAGVVRGQRRTDSPIAVLPFVFPVLCAIATIAQTRGTDRARLVWATSRVGHTIRRRRGRSAWRRALVFRSVRTWSSRSINVTAFYHTRRFDVRGTDTASPRHWILALNRALVFSAVSFVFVGTFLLVEWALGRVAQQRQPHNQSSSSEPRSHLGSDYRCAVSISASIKFSIQLFFP